MKFSLMLSFVSRPADAAAHRETIKQLDRLAPLAEALQFHALHITEHHFQNDGWLPSPLLVLAKAAGLTRRMRLVTNILVSTLYAPVQLLEDLATLDNLSEGRLTFGTSPGYVSEEFAGRGISYEQRFALHEEIIDFLQQAWRHPDDFGFTGKFFAVPHLRLTPAPVQRELPIWYGVSGPKLLERAARRRVPVTASPRHTEAELREHFARFEAAAARYGYQPDTRPVIRDSLILDTTAEAEAYGRPGIMGLFGLYSKKSAAGERALSTDTGELVTDETDLDFQALASRTIIGDAAYARERVSELVREIHPTELILRMQMPGVPTEVLERAFRVVAEQVMPHFV
jgi:alkanesulfonate monooxygenase SsuD/methylene tetrahydromethanopterin reductase-like flavin-dependent oxidoreductase (luciferase family)